MTEFTTVYADRASEIGLESIQRDEVGLSTRSYIMLFGNLLKNGSRRSAARGVLKIQRKEGGPVIYRRYRGLSKLHNDEVLLDNLSIAEMHPKGESFSESVNLSIRAAGCFGRTTMYWHHPEDAPRVAYRIGVIAIAITVFGVIVSVLTWSFPWKSNGLDGKARIEQSRVK